MGKIRISALGDEEAEKKQAQEAKKRRDAKKEKKGEAPEADQASAEARTADAESKKLPPQLRKKRVIGKNQKAAAKLVDPEKKYTLKDAIALLRKLSYAKFDQTVELHLNLKEKGLRGDLQLPHGTGKELNVVIADEKLLNDIEAGNLDFDVLIASPSFMPKLVPFAKVLGPKGLMPNPKNGTVSDKPEEAAKKFKGGAIQFKAEPKAPILHQAIGKMSFKDVQLVDNAEALMNAVKREKVTSAFISASMTPSISLEL